MTDGTEAPLVRELDVARRLAREAGARARRLQREGLAVDRKGDGSFVSNADRDLNALLVAGLGAAFPADLVLGEESAGGAGRAGARLWLVDPIDGTHEFVQGGDEWSVVIGLLIDGAPALGVVHHAASGTTYLAARGAGASREDADGRRAPLRCAAPAADRAPRWLGSRSRPDPLADQVRRRTGAGPATPMGSVGLKAAAIARGDFDLYLNSAGLCGPWDTCAAEVLLAEAGGCLRPLSGERLDYRHAALGRIEARFVAGEREAVDRVLRALWDARTRRGQTPDDYFAALAGSGDPWLVVPVGISGSGKSTWTRAATRRGFAAIGADDLRVKHLEALRAAGRTIVAGGRERPADPGDPGQVFCPELRAQVPALIAAALEAELAARRSVVLDVTNLTLARVPFMHEARRAGYHVAALVFESHDLRLNLERIERRAALGGVDLAPKGTSDPRAYRLQALETLQGNFDAFCRGLAEGTLPDALVREPLPPGPALEAMRSARGSWTAWLAALDPRERGAAEAWRARDVFTRVDLVDLWPGVVAPTVACPHGEIEEAGRGEHERTHDRGQRRRGG